MTTISIQTTVQFYVENCYRCGIPFGIPVQFQRDRRQDRESFWCPNGHKQAYIGETDAEKLEKARQQLERERTRTRQVADQRDAAERSNTALRGVVTRKTKQLTRVKNGVCPECNRTFQDLARHMTTKHPHDTKEN